MASTYPDSITRLALTVLVFFCSATSADAWPIDEKLSSEEQTLLDLTNRERRLKNLPALKVHPQLMKAAREHAANMAKQQKLDHHLDGKDMSDRIKAQGYAFSEAGENIAHKAGSVRLVMKKWMESEDHRNNILSEEYVEIGLGLAKSEKGEYYWVQVFATPLFR
ncbi:MAG: CAP domain-containing protein [Planctomycetia bacterium]|nr:CAP domain-containing protein [Planctomycetia bacterium]